MLPFLFALISQIQQDNTKSIIYPRIFLNYLQKFKI